MGRGYQRKQSPPVILTDVLAIFLGGYEPRGPLTSPTASLKLCCPQPLTISCKVQGDDSEMEKANDADERRFHS